MQDPVQNSPSTGPSSALPRKSSPSGTPRLLPHEKLHPAAGLQGLFREKVRPARPLQRLTREKTRPARHKPPIVGHFSCAGRTLSRSHPPPDHAGRIFSRTGHSHVATAKPTTPLQPLMQASVKPPSPMLAPKQRPLKPPSPLQPKNAPKTPISHPQRRWRFQSHTSTSEQRRWRFQTTGPAGLQGLAVAPMSGGGAWPGDQWAANVTNVVKPTRFQSPRENPCDKRRQSKPKNRHFQRKSPRIDDVCNAGTEIHTKNTLD